MNWSTNKSILLSRICVAIFALLLAALDFGAYWLVTWYIHLRGMAWQSGAGMIVTLYLCSIFGWVLLWQMWTLLNNIRRSEVFIPENIRCLRMVLRGRRCDMPCQHAVLHPLRRHCDRGRLHGAHRAHRQKRVRAGHPHEG